MEISALDPGIITLIWLVAGILMLASEIVLPGMVIGFLGAASILVAGCRFAGLIESLGASLGLWLVTSVGLVLGLRNLAKKYFPSEEHRANVDEASEAFGAEVIVLSDCNENSSEGRIRYQGTSWPAKTVEGKIPAGHKAKLVYRDNVAWVIEAVEVNALIEEGGSVKVPEETAKERSDAS